MNIFKELHERLNFFAENIAAEVAEKRYYEIAEIKAIAKTRLWFALSDCLEIQVTDSEVKRRNLAIEYNRTDIPNWRKKEISLELVKVNGEKKDANRLMHTIQDYNEYEQLKHYIEDKFGYEHLDYFFKNYVNRDEYTSRLKRIKDKTLKL